MYIEKRDNNILAISIKAELNISQNIHDIAVLNAIKDFFNCGSLSPKLKDINNLNEIKSSGKLAVAYINTITSSFIPFFDQYPLFTQKQLDYLDMKKFKTLQNSKAYLTKEGFIKMLEIINGMNSGRFGISKRKPIILPEWNENTKVVLK
jgi:hypothetical protein